MDLQAIVIIVALCAFILGLLLGVMLLRPQSPGRMR